MRDARRSSRVPALTGLRRRPSASIVDPADNHDSTTPRSATIPTWKPVPAALACGGRRGSSRSRRRRCAIRWCSSPSCRTRVPPTGSSATEAISCCTSNPRHLQQCQCTDTARAGPQAVVLYGVATDSDRCTAHRGRLREARSVTEGGRAAGLGDGERGDGRREEERLGPREEGEPRAVAEGWQEGRAGRGETAQGREIGLGPEGGGDAEAPGGRRKPEALAVEPRVSPWRSGPGCLRLARTHSTSKSLHRPRVDCPRAPPHILPGHPSQRESPSPAMLVSPGERPAPPGQWHAAGSLLLTE